jgi:hypothetical protein
MNHFLLRQRRGAASIVLNSAVLNSANHAKQAFDQEARVEIAAEYPVFCSLTNDSADHRYKLLPLAAVSIFIGSRKSGRIAEQLEKLGPVPKIQHDLPDNRRHRLGYYYSCS